MDLGVDHLCSCLGWDSLSGVPPNQLAKWSGIAGVLETSLWASILFIVLQGLDSLMSLLVGLQTMQ